MTPFRRIITETPAMKPTELAYFAGLLDGEGCIRVKRQRKYWGPKQALDGWQYGVAVYIANTVRAPLDQVCTLFGGSVARQSSQGREGQKPVYRWTIGQLQAERFLRAVRPYMRIKHAQADNALAFRRWQGTGRKHRTKIVGERSFPNLYGGRMIPNRAYSDEYLAECERFFLRAKELNAA